jgi:hypothetical protein
MLLKNQRRDTCMTESQYMRMSLCCKLCNKEAKHLQVNLRLVADWVYKPASPAMERDPERKTVNSQVLYMF